MDEIINQTSPIIESIPTKPISKVSSGKIIKNKLAIWVWLIPLIFIIFIYIIFKQQQLITTNKQEISENIIPTTKQTQQPADYSGTTSYTDQIVRIYPSLNNHFSFYIYTDISADSANKCAYGIIDKQGDKHYISKVLGTETITCIKEMGGFTSSFIGWADGNKFLISEKDGEINIIDIAKLEPDTYKFDATKYNFEGASRTLKYWLFRKKDKDNEVSYVLFNRNNNIVLDNINFDSNWNVLYDEVNDGFLFISRTYTGENVSVKFDFLSMSNPALRTLLITEPVQKRDGRGCLLEYLISQPGEIILTQGCLTVDNKYLDTDGNIHIKI